MKFFSLRTLGLTVSKKIASCSSEKPTNKNWDVDPVIFFSPKLRYPTMDRQIQGLIDGKSLNVGSER
jgi:hypothetical protein